MKPSIAVMLFCAASFSTGAARADALSLPHQKAGLWQQVVTMGGRDISDQVCLDTATEAKFSSFGPSMAQRTCQSRNVSHNLDGSWTITSSCTMGHGLTATSHVVVTGDFSSKFRAVVDSTMSGSPIAAMNGTHQTVIASTWLGPCKPGQKGGDVVMSNGVKVNVMGAAGH